MLRAEVYARALRANQNVKESGGMSGRAEAAPCPCKEATLCERTLGPILTGLIDESEAEILHMFFCYHDDQYRKVRNKSEVNSKNYIFL